MKEYWTTLASMMGVWAFYQTLVQTLIPPQLRHAFLNLFYRFFNCCSSYCYYDITEIDGVNTNELYNAVQMYLSSSASIIGNRLSLTRNINSTAITFGLSNNDRLVDNYKGVEIHWEHFVRQRETHGFSWRPLPEEKRAFTLRVKKKDKGIVLGSYLDYIMEKAIELRRKNEDRLLYTNSRGGSLDSRGHHPWESVPFKHPSTFQTLAMDPVKKGEIMADLKDFANGESFYQRTGRAWKRGYLLFGPPGTGKSSMIAAMANFLGYDIYDLELTEVTTNSELRKLLMKTSSKSIIVIEDIDCSINLTNRPKKNNHPDVEFAPPGTNDPENDSSASHKITLSGLLNFTDGLWSCCGSERIFVFTTNHIDKLDPALLRSGRMDMHIHMSYCCFEAMKILFKNYLGIDESDLDEDMLKEFEEVVDKAEMTPADISELLIKNRRDKEKALRELLDVLKVKAEKNGGKNEEEQEKRALECDKDGDGDGDFNESFNKVEEHGENGN